MVIGDCGCFSLTTSLIPCTWRVDVKSNSSTEVETGLGCTEEGLTK